MRATWILSMAILVAGAAAPPASAQAPPRARAAGSIFTQASYLGIGAKDIDSERAQSLKLKEVRGAEVTSVAADSPAAKAGIKEGDVIVEFNGQTVEGTDQLTRMVRETPAGRQVKLGIWRNGSTQPVTATTEPKRVLADGNIFSIPSIPEFKEFPKIPEMPYIEIPKFQMMYQNPMLGIFGEPLGQQEQLAEFFGVKEGVLIKSVTRGSAAEKAGIKAGDVITRVEETSVNSVRDITNALRAARSKSSVSVIVVRNRKEMPVTVTMDALATPPVKAYMLRPGKGLKMVPVLKLRTQNRVI